MNDDEQQRLDLLILARLATAGPRPPSLRKLQDDLFVFVEAQLSRGEWSSRCTERLEALRARGDVDERRVPTDAGSTRVRAALGVEVLPDKWTAVWQALVPALVLDLPGARWAELAKAENLRGRLIRQHRRLDASEVPTLGEAVDAQAWEQLGVDETGALGATRVKLALMRQALGIPVRSIAEAVNAYCWTLLGEPAQVDFPLGRLRRVLLEKTLGTTLRAKTLDASKVGELLSTEAAGTTKAEINVIRRALVSRWIFDGAKAAGRAGVPSPGAAATAEVVEVAVARPAASDPSSLEHWAREVQAVANATQTGRYGDERVFISSAWHAAQARSSLSGTSLDAFKAQLVAANRAGLLRLHRADLVGAMDRTLVRESETQHLTATFHFIETHSRRPA
jgi:hypothetical protein